MTRITVDRIKNKKQAGEKIAMLTAYDATFGRLLDNAGIDIILVGDSVGMVIQGNDTTIPVTLDEIIYHTKAVIRGTQHAHVVSDMPFMSYQANLDDAVANAGKLLKEGHAQSVKLEGGIQLTPLITRLTQSGIPVMGHIGLTPQSFHQLSGFRVQGRNKKQAKQLIEDAKAIEQAGAYALVLESIPHHLAQEITQAISIPTIGIGAGVHCDGQVLVIYDLLGMDDTFTPKFVRRYEALSQKIQTAVSTYITDVRQETFPSLDESFDSNH